MGMVIVVMMWLGMVVDVIAAPVVESFTKAEPQYQRALMYICCVPCTIQARRTQDLIGAPPKPIRTQYWIHQEYSDSPSSPKFSAKNKDPLDDATE